MAQPTTSVPVSPSPQTSPAPEPVPEPPAAVSGPVAFVQSYYALLPEDTDRAFALLSPAAQRASNGKSGYDAFYARMESVSLENVRAVGENTVEARVVFDESGGPTRLTNTVRDLDRPGVQRSWLVQQVLTVSGKVTSHTCTHAGDDDVECDATGCHGRGRRRRRRRRSVASVTSVMSIVAVRSGIRLRAGEVW